MNNDNKTIICFMTFKLERRIKYLTEEESRMMQAQYKVEKYLASGLTELSGLTGSDDKTSTQRIYCNKTNKRN